ncbi:MAG: hypothetical protein GY820_17215 [Gammaproteobacteria bacterium]|nr:hypothetical protein [Gammaproteobacteria bacterium]
MIDIKVTPKTKQVLLQFDRMPRKAEAGLYTALHGIGDEFVKEERRLQRLKNKTGRWYAGVRASAPGEVPAKRTGKLSRSTRYRVHSPFYMSFGQSMDYAKYLADGTSRMAPRANLRQAVNNKIGLAHSIIIQHVNRSTGLDSA